MVVIVNGKAYQVNWGQNDTPGSIAKNLAAALQADGSVTPTLAGATLYLNPRQAGASYSFLTGYTYDSADFKQASFTSTNSISDYGTAGVAVNGHNDQVSFAGHDTPARVLPQLSPVILIMMARRS